MFNGSNPQLTFLNSSKGKKEEMVPDDGDHQQEVISKRLIGYSRSAGAADRVAPCSPKHICQPEL